MATTIEWTRGDDGSPGETWNPLRARHNGKLGWSCVKVSPGCAHCYAGDRVNRRFGTGLDYTVGNNALVEHILDESVLRKPLSWRKPRRVFVCSMTDLFGEWVPDEWLDRVFAVMALAQRHCFMVLTKRPERMRAYFAGDGDTVSRNLRVSAAVVRAGESYLHGGYKLYIDDMAQSVAGFEGTAHGPWWPLPNVWVGVSVEDQQRVDERIPLLLDTPAAVRFVSAEPLLGPIDLRRACDYTRDFLSGIEFELLTPWPDNPPHIDWLILGGESGPDARPFDIAWARSLIAQCWGGDVPVFVKQLGANVVHNGITGPGEHWPGREPVRRSGEVVQLPGQSGLGWRRRLRSSHGSDPAEWPEDLRIREFPSV